MKKGRLEVICGSMFSGKSEELIRRMRRAHFAHQPLQAFKHSFDVQRAAEDIHSHDGSSFHAHPIDTVEGIQRILKKETAIVAIDEIQFFSPTIIAYLFSLVDEGKRMIVAGLDLDFRGLPFGCMPTLLALADCVTKLTAVCMACGQEAHFTQRLVNGKPAKTTDPLILIGAEECYQARCRDCFVIDISPAHQLKAPQWQN